jgi:hypothetical protein
VSSDNPRESQVEGIVNKAWNLKKTNETRLSNKAIKIIHACKHLFREELFVLKSVAKDYFVSHGMVN